MLARADISAQDRARAQFALAQDYAKAGLLDRAEAALQGTDLGLKPLESLEALQLLLGIYERGRDWVGADRIAQALQAKGAGNFDKRRGHYLCEQKKFEEAMALSPACPRAYLELAAMHAQQGDNAASQRLLSLAAKNAPEAMPLLALPLLNASKGAEERAQTIALLAHSYEQTHSLDVLSALISAGWQDERLAYAAHLDHEPSLVAASHLIDEPKVQAALAKATTPLMRYRCASCGFESKQYFWQCPGCQTWDSYPFQRIEEL